MWPSRVPSSAPMPSAANSAFWRGMPSFSISMCASSATNEPSFSSASGLISASVMSLSRNRRARRASTGVARCSALPVTPAAAITCLAWKSENGSSVEKWPRPTWSGCSSATCSMSIPPMSLNSISGFFAVPSQTTPA